jgi:CYTH domain-containing protein
MLTNIYLDAEEYERLLVLPAAELRKTRFSLTVGEVRFAIDVLRDQLDGLVLAEYEVDVFPTDGQVALDYVADVTHDDRFSGGQLARTSAEALRSLLTAFGVHVP